MFQKYLIIIHLFFGLIISAHAQMPQPLIFKALNPPIANVFPLEEVGLLAISDNANLQIWDKNSKAFFGFVEVIPQGFYNDKIIHVEYLKSTNKLAVVAEQLIRIDAQDTVYSTNLFLIDLNLANASANTRFIGDGFLQLLKYKYSNKIIFPELLQAAQISRYYFNDSTGTLYTITRKGVVNIYAKGKLNQTIQTGMINSQFIVSDKHDLKFYVSDQYTYQIKQYSINQNKFLQLYDFLPIQYKTYPNLYLVNHEFQVTITAMASANALVVVDSINRFTIIDIESGQHENIPFGNYDYFKILHLRPFKIQGKFAEAVAIAESTLPPFQRVCLYINTKSGILNNLLTGITPTISKVGYTKNPTGFRMMVSGLSEIEIDLSTLTEKSIGNFFSVNNDSVTDFGVWEQGYYQRLANPKGMEYIKVYQKDTVGTSLLYSIPIKIKAKEQLAGIVPTRKGYITYAPSTEAISKNTIEIYDSAANKIQSISTHYPLQTLNNASKEQKLFSKNGLYMMLKESIIATAGIDSCRLRIFEVQSFKTIFDESYIEHVGVNFWQRQTAYFTDSSNGFYIVKAKRGTSDIANYLHYYNLQNGKFVFKNKTQLCLDNSCKIIANIRQLRVNSYNTVMLWFGDVADNPISKVPGYQFVILTDVKTGKHISGLNMPLFPALVNVLQYKDYFLLQFTDHIKVVQPTPNFTNHFLTIVPQINEGLGELNTLFFNENTATNKFWYYEKSNSDESISFRIGNSSFRRKQFDIAFNRPDMILSAIPGHDSTYLQQYKKAIIKRNERIKNVLQDFRLENLPVITLNENATKFVRDNVFTIAIDVATKLPLQKFIITVNGNRQERNASTVPNRKNNLHTFFIEEKLSNGFNNIEISAVNESNFESLPLRLTQDYFGNTQKPNLHVLAISVGAYKNGLSNLPYAVKDGRDVAQLFNTYRKDTLYKQIFIDTLFNDAATMEATILWLKSLQNLSPNDHVLIFYSGHGFLDSNYNLQLATTGFLKQRNQIKTIEYEALIQIIDALPARQKLLLIDACQSGDFDRNITDSSDFVNNKNLSTDSLYTPKGIKLPTQRLQQENSFEQMQQLFSFSEMGNGTVVISAAGGTQSAFENKKYKNGYFTYALKEALLEYKAAPSYELNKIITLNQLVKYLKKRVAELTNGRQIPNLRINNPDLNWRVR